MWEKIKPFIKLVLLFVAGLIVGGIVFFNIGNGTKPSDVYIERLDDAIQRFENGSAKLEENFGNLIESNKRLQDNLSASIDGLGETVKQLTSGSDRVEVISGNLEESGRELADIYHRVRERPVKDDVQP